MKLTKGKISKLYNKKHQSHRRNKKMPKNNRSFRKRKALNLASRSLKMRGGFISGSPDAFIQGRMTKELLDLAKPALEYFAEKGSKAGSYLYDKAKVNVYEAKSSGFKIFYMSEKSAFDQIVKNIGGRSDFIRVIPKVIDSDADLYSLYNLRKFYYIVVPLKITNVFNFYKDYKQKVNAKMANYTYENNKALNAILEDESVEKSVYFPIFENDVNYITEQFYKKVFGPKVDIQRITSLSDGQKDELFAKVKPNDVINNYGELYKIKLELEGQISKSEFDEEMGKIEQAKKPDAKKVTFFDLPFFKELDEIETKKMSDTQQDSELLSDKRAAAEKAAVFIKENIERKKKELAEKKQEKEADEKLLQEAKTELEKKTAEEESANEEKKKQLVEQVAALKTKVEDASNEIELDDKNIDNLEKEQDELSSKLIPPPKVSDFKSSATKEELDEFNNNMKKRIDDSKQKEEDAKKSTGAIVDVMERRKLATSVSDSDDDSDSESEGMLDEAFEKYEKKWEAKRKEYRSTLSSSFNENATADQIQAAIGLAQKELDNNKSFYSSNSGLNEQMLPASLDLEHLLSQDTPVLDEEIKSFIDTADKLLDDWNTLTKSKWEKIVSEIQAKIDAKKTEISDVSNKKELKSILFENEIADRYSGFKLSFDVMTNKLIDEVLSKNDHSISTLPEETKGKLDKITSDKFINDETIKKIYDKIVDDSSWTESNLSDDLNTTIYDLTKEVWDYKKYTLRLLETIYNYLKEKGPQNSLQIFYRWLVTDKVLKYDLLTPNFAASMSEYEKIMDKIVKITNDFNADYDVDYVIRVEEIGVRLQKIKKTLVDEVNNIFRKKYPKTSDVTTMLKNIEEDLKMPMYGITDDSYTSPVFNDKVGGAAPKLSYDEYFKFINDYAGKLKSYKDIEDMKNKIHNEYLKDSLDESSYKRFTFDLKNLENAFYIISLGKLRTDQRDYIKDLDITTKVFFFFYVINLIDNDKISERIAFLDSMIENPNAAITSVVDKMNTKKQSVGQDTPELLKTIDTTIELAQKALEQNPEPSASADVIPSIASPTIASPTSAIASSPGTKTISKLDETESGRKIREMLNQMVIGLAQEIAKVIERPEIVETDPKYLIDAVEAILKIPQNETSTTSDSIFSKGLFNISNVTNKEIGVSQTGTTDNGTNDKFQELSVKIDSLSKTVGALQTSPDHGDSIKELSDVIEKLRQDFQTKQQQMPQQMPQRQQEQQRQAQQQTFNIDASPMAITSPMATASPIISPMATVSPVNVNNNITIGSDPTRQISQMNLDYEPQLKLLQDQIKKLQDEKQTPELPADNSKQLQYRIDELTKEYNDLRKQMDDERGKLGALIEQQKQQIEMSEEEKRRAIEEINRIQQDERAKLDEEIKLLNQSGSESDVKEQIRKLTEEFQTRFNTQIDEQTTIRNTEITRLQQEFKTKFESEVATHNEELEKRSSELEEKLNAANASIAAAEARISAAEDARLKAEQDAMLKAKQDEKTDVNVNLRGSTINLSDLRSKIELLISNLANPNEQQQNYKLINELLIKVRDLIEKKDSLTKEQQDELRSILEMIQLECTLSDCTSFDQLKLEIDKLKQSLTVSVPPVPLPPVPLPSAPSLDIDAIISQLNALSTTVGDIDVTSLGTEINMLVQLFGKMSDNRKRKAMQQVSLIITKLNQSENKEKYGPVLIQLKQLFDDSNISGDLQETNDLLNRLLQQQKEQSDQSQKVALEAEERKLEEQRQRLENQQRFDELAKIELSKKQQGQPGSVELKVNVAPLVPVAPQVQVTSATEVTKSNDIIKSVDPAQYSDFQNNVMNGLLNSLKGGTKLREISQPVQNEQPRIFSNEMVTNFNTLINEPTNRKLISESIYSPAPTVMPSELKETMKSFKNLINKVIYNSPVNLMLNSLDYHVYTKIYRDASDETNQTGNPTILKYLEEFADFIFIDVSQLNQFMPLECGNRMITISSFETENFEDQLYTFDCKNGLKQITKYNLVHEPCHEILTKISSTDEVNTRRVNFCRENSFLKTINRFQSETTQSETTQSETTQSETTKICHILELIALITSYINIGDFTNLLRGTNGLYNFLYAFMNGRIHKLNNLLDVYVNICSQPNQFAELEQFLTGNDSILAKYVISQNQDNMITYLKLNNKGDTNNFEYNKYRFDLMTDKQRNYLQVKYNDNNESYVGGDKPTYSNKYLFGRFDKIYTLKNSATNLQITNKEIAASMTVAKEKILKGDPVFLIGYGASGAGKTSTLVYLNAPGVDDAQRAGILIHLCNQFGEMGYNDLTVTTQEFFETTNALGKCNVHDGIGNICEEQTFKFKFENSEFNKTEGDIKTKFDYRPDEKPKSDNLGEVLVYLIDADRFVKPTTNNPNSSRSHSLIYVMMKNDEGKTLQFFIGDFAGVENIFDCMKQGVLRDMLNMGSDTTLTESTYVPKQKSATSIEPGLGHVTLLQANKVFNKPIVYDENGDLIKKTDESFINAIQNIQTPYDSLKKNAVYNLLATTTDNKYTIEQGDQTFSSTSSFITDISNAVNTSTLTSLLNQKANLLDVKLYPALITLIEQVYNDTFIQKFNKTANISIKWQYANTCSLGNYFLFNKAERGDCPGNVGANSKLLEQILKNSNATINSITELNKTFNFLTPSKKKGGGRKTAKKNQKTKRKSTRKMRGGVNEQSSFVNSNTQGPLEQTDYDVTSSNTSYKNEQSYKTNETFRKQLDMITSATTYNELKTITDLFPGRKVTSYNLRKSKSLPPGYTATLYDKVRDALTARYAEIRKEINKKLKKVPKTPNAIEKYKSLLAEAETFVRKNSDLTQKDIYVARGILETQLKNQIVPKPVEQPQILEVIEDPSIIAAKERLQRKQLAAKEAQDKLDNLLAATLNPSVEQQTDLVKGAFQICMERVSEGRFINSSLKELRENIFSIMIEKTQNCIYYSPPFNADCLNAFCPTGDNCFSLRKNPASPILSEPPSLIMKWIFKKYKTGSGELTLTEFYKKILIGVFCVLNVSPTANNPPPIPYIDINKLKLLWETKKDLIYTDETAKQTSTALQNEVEQILVRIKTKYDPKQIEMVVQYLENNQFYKVPFVLTINKTIDKEYINKMNKLIDTINNHNSITAVGTLEYLDSVAKLNTTNILCGDTNIDTNFSLITSDITDPQPL